jgi:hypothetical protein
MVMTTAIHTDTDMDMTTAMATRMGETTAAITVARATGMATRMGVTMAATTAAQVTEMAIPPIQEWPSCNADLPGPGITLALSMESWGLRLGKQFTLGSVIMGMEAN